MNNLPWVDRLTDEQVIIMADQLVTLGMMEKRGEEYHLTEAGKIWTAEYRKEIEEIENARAS